MKLTRLRLLGFKSFVEPTDFLIEPGLTGVVGPNGCGKSNLVEALRWVMGESSYKSMRASSMDDVIFSGNNTRPARNNAEVAITIDNSERSAPANFNDTDMLEIARRIERESGSNYRINGRDVRARDVQILFADASTGARSPALVHQGRIGEIIQAKPEQRRRVLEEAAGISGLHARRHEAELRLKAAEANLLRAEDVIGQLAAQMEALKKQARQAIRYRTVSAQVRKAEATLYHLRWTAATIEVTDAESAKDLCVREVAARTEAEVEASKRQALAAASLPELREAEAAAGAALHRLNVALADLDREEQRAKDRIAELDKRLVQFAADSERERRLAADAEAAIARIAAEEETIRAEAHANAGRRSGVDAKVAEADGALSAAEKIFSELTAKLADLTARAQSARKRRARAHRARRPRRQRDRRHRARARRPAGDRRPRPRRARRRRRRGAAGRRRRRERRARSRSRARRRAPATGGDAQAARRGRTPRAAAGDRSQDPVQGAGGRDQEPVAAGDGPHLGRQGLREGARRRARRRPRCAGRSVGADALDGLGHRSRRSGAAGGRRAAAQHVQAPDELARRLNQIGVVDKETGARLAGSSSPASGWCRAKATCGAGTASPPPRMRRPAPPAVWPSAPASPKSKPSCSRPAPRPRPRASSRRPPKPPCAWRRRPRPRRAMPRASVSATSMPRATGTRRPSARPIATPRACRRWKRRAPA